MNRRLRIAAFALLVTAFLAMAAPVVAQASPSSAPNAAAGQHRVAAKEAAADETEAFRLSPAVRWLAHLTGMSPTTAYWVFILINFAVVAALIGFFMKSKLPAWFRARTEAIRSQMEEARRLSAEANARLAEIEARLGRLDSEIAQMRGEADAEARREEERIAAAAAEDKQRIIATAEQEIDACSRLARRDLKAYAAALAVELAEQRIQVDPGTDRALVRNFAQQLGKDEQ